MKPTREEIQSIYAGIETVPGLTADIQGWNSENPIFERLIFEVRPRVIVEVGVWKGASLIHMARLAKKHGFDTRLYGVDVWFGSVGTMIGNPTPTPIPPRWDKPTHYQQFLFNVKSAGFDDRIIPVWNLTRWGALSLSSWGVVADLLYVDAGHDREPVLQDLRLYWPILRKGGVMFGDDYSDTYPGVAEALAIFAAEIGHTFTVDGCQWQMEAKK